jgi:hypothetical protein
MPKWSVVNSQDGAEKLPGDTNDLELTRTYTLKHEETGEQREIVFSVSLPRETTDTAVQSYLDKDAPPEHVRSSVLLAVPQSDAAF